LVLQTAGSTTALTLDNAQNATFAGSVSAPNTFGFKNRIINGDMRIDQRNAGTSNTITTTYYTLDRWQAGSSSSSKYSVQQNAGTVTPPIGFTNYLGATSLTANTVGVAEQYFIRHFFEGYNAADLGWGTVNAQTVTLSFWTYSSLTGTFGGCIHDNPAARSYVFSYNISTANTWTKSTITIPGDTTGTYSSNTDKAMAIVFSFGVGSNFQTTTNTWSTGNYKSFSGETQLVATNGAKFYITGVQLEKGSQATTFDFRDYIRELQLCQRYFETSYSNGTSVGSANTYGAAATTSNGAGYWILSVPFSVVKRIPATIITYSTATGTANRVRLTGGSAADQTPFTSTNGTSSYRISSNGATTVNGFFEWQWTADAEL
jgi:hypothetical protein